MTAVVMTSATSSAGGLSPRGRSKDATSLMDMQQQLPPPHHYHFHLPSSSSSPTTHLVPSIDDGHNHDHHDGLHPESLMKPIMHDIDLRDRDAYHDSQGDHLARRHLHEDDKDGTSLSQARAPSPSIDRHVLIALPTALPISSTAGTSATSDTTASVFVRFKGLFAAVSYGLVSMCAILVNKAVLSSWEFGFPLTMIAFQMMISFTLLWTLRKCGWIHYDDWSYATAKKAAPMALTHVGNVLLGLAALNLVDVPMFGALRRTSIVFVLVMEYLFLGKSFSRSVLVATMLIVLGAIVGGWGDLHFDLFGYGLTSLVNVTTALALVLIPKLGAATKLDAFGLMLYQITVSFPFVVFGIFYTGEFQAVAAYPYLHNPGFQLSFFISSAQIFLVNYTLFLCTQLNSPLTTSVTGTIKNIGESVLGFSFFSVPVDPINLAGIAIGFMGSVVYTAVKCLEQRTIVPPASTKKSEA